MELSSEDTLRLNVLLANSQAVRISEQHLCVYGLCGEGEARVQLNPTCRADRYLRYVREMLSSAILGSPGGYPVYLKRWTRMGQINNTRLQDLLMLGEPEAVVAVTRSPALTDELARRAWWAMPDAENARRMLRQSAVVSGAMGRVLAEFLVEFLPFEEDPHTIIESVSLVLQPGLIDDAVRREIWTRGLKKNVFLVGFLLATPDALPDPLPPHPHALVLQSQLPALGENLYAAQLQRALSQPGQTFLHACETVLRRPSNQDVVVAVLEALGGYFESARGDMEQSCEIGHMLSRARSPACADPGRANALETLQQRLPERTDQLAALLFLSQLGEPVVRSIFAHTDAVGSLMRRKLEPVISPILEQLSVLQAPKGDR